MLIYPAIDLFDGKAVRLLRGDYAQMTVYSEHPEEIALDFAAQGASRIHLVDLEGAKSGETPNFDTVLRIKKASGLFCEIGGGVRNMEVISRYLDAGIDRVILGTAAVTQPGFVAEAAAKYGEKIAVGVDVKDGYVAVKGWTEKSEEEAFAFCRRMNDIGVRTLICTDISRDGAMQGTNLNLYRELSQSLGMQIIASGGVSSMDDVRALAAMDIHGAIIGKAYYTGAIQLREAIEVGQ
ncbi:MAG: 1-(5-phosphoribosyl)-5-[(5-phosphoribosylamino)methylideneamino]imidazole-4-carboxamide isomerase [bacterium]|nr:1-(5-phosphoribosyl)-5-[(5-phosphoribosylamino)methylideneamino]imidazole-4-carboxamide isomerase [bacterium]